VPKQKPFDYANAITFRALPAIYFESPAAVGRHLASAVAYESAILRFHNDGDEVSLRAGLEATGIPFTDFDIDYAMSSPGGRDVLHFR
jgi:hypothetical protein